MPETKEWIDQVRRIDAPDLWHRIEARSHQPSGTSQPVREGAPGRRVVAGVVAFAVFAAAGVFAWEAFRDRPEPPAIHEPTPTREVPLPEDWTNLGPLPRVPTPATIWTGSELISWGGGGEDGPGPLRSDGFRFDPLTGDVATIPTAPLAPRSDPATAWTGEELLVWGGWEERPPFSGDGAAYNPVTDTWRQLPPAPISARVPLSAWTGKEWILWGTSVRVDDRPVDGAAYNPSTDTWRSIADGPIELTDATATWTGTEFVVVGAALHGGNHAETPTAVAAAYDPATDSWRDLPAPPLDPNSNTTVSAQGRIVGVDYDHVTAEYDPATDSWSQIERFPGDECEGGLAQAQSAQGWVVVADCGTIATLRPDERRWSVPSDGPDTFYARTFAGDGTIFVVAFPQAQDDEVALWSFRPPGSGEGHPSPDPRTVAFETFGIARPASELATAGGYVWAAEDLNKTIQKLDPTTGEVVSTISLIGYPAWLASGTSQLWVAVAAPDDSSWVLGIDPVTDEPVVTISGVSGPLVETDEGLWAFSEQSGSPSMVLLDRVTGELIRSVDVPGQPFDVAASGSSVWFLDMESGDVFLATEPGEGRTQPVTDRSAGIELAGSPSGVYLSTWRGDSANDPTFPGTSAFASLDGQVQPFGDIYNFRPMVVTGDRVWFVAGPHDGDVAGLCGMRTADAVVDRCADIPVGLEGIYDPVAFEPVTGTLWAIAADQPRLYRLNAS